jgi:hypothetical protein
MTNENQRRHSPQSAHGSRSRAALWHFTRRASAANSATSRNGTGSTHFIVRVRRQSIEFASDGWPASRSAVTLTSSGQTPD